LGTAVEFGETKNPLVARVSLFEREETDARVVDPYE
jgi:hypothetical protein